MKTKLLFPCAATLLLAGCLSTPVRQTNWRPQDEGADFSADGRLAVQHEGKGSYANFDWNRQNGVQTINVNTPLGNTLGQICRDSQGVLAVNAKGERFTAPDVRQLSQKLLGFALPLEYLDVWMRGQWAADLPHSLTAEGDLQQAGWNISRQTQEDGSVRVLALRNEQLSLRLVFDSVMPSENGADAPTQCAARG